MADQRITDKSNEYRSSTQYQLTHCRLDLPHLN